MNNKECEDPAMDKIAAEIGEYVHEWDALEEEMLESSRLCLMDSISCAMGALAEPECHKLIGPLVPGGEVPAGARVVGTRHQLDPVKVAFDNATLVGWLDLNDAWGEGDRQCRPSESLGAILAVTDYLSRRRRFIGDIPVVMGDVLAAMVKAYEIQVALTTGNDFARQGIDRTFLVKVAAAALAAHLLGGNPRQIADAVSQAFADGAPLSVYRQPTRVGGRQSWAGGDAASRGVRLAMITLSGEQGIPAAISATGCGFQDAALGGETLKLGGALGSQGISAATFKLSSGTGHVSKDKAMPQLREKCRAALATRFPAARAERILGVLEDPEALSGMAVSAFTDLLVI